jgi:predicted nuclease of predicted toxin-antitoxin system
MKFLIDAQLPRRLAHHLRGMGHETLHTLDLPQGNRTQDDAISALSAREDWIVITKDADFVNSFLLRHEPRKLLLVATGNIKNIELEQLFTAHFHKVLELFELYNFLELSRENIVIHQ